MFRKIVILTTALNALALSAVAAQHGTCDSILKLSLHSEGKSTRIDAKNASGKPIAAYVVVAEPKSSDNAHRSIFQG